MLSFIKECNKEIESISITMKELKGEKFSTDYSIGNSNFHLADLSDSSALFLGGLLHSRLEGAKLIGNEELIAKMTEEVANVKSTIVKIKKLNELYKERGSYKMLVLEAERLLSVDEHKQVLKEKLSELLKVS